ncbi:MAG: hypothetical protein HZA48_07285 [Planctomycetes bacterium]|nr:hypothetical protein [Planctomycetota bacterium]
MTNEKHEMSNEYFKNIYKQNIDRWEELLYKKDPVNNSERRLLRIAYSGWTPKTEEEKVFKWVLLQNDLLRYSERGTDMPKQEAGKPKTNWIGSQSAWDNMRKGYLGDSLGK